MQLQPPSGVFHVWVRNKHCLSPVDYELMLIRIKSCQKRITRLCIFHNSDSSLGEKQLTGCASMIESIHWLRCWLIAAIDWTHWRKYRWCSLCWCQMVRLHHRVLFTVGTHISRRLSNDYSSRVLFDQWAVVREENCIFYQSSFIVRSLKPSKAYLVNITAFSNRLVT